MSTAESQLASLAGEAFDPARLIDVQPGAIVSRTLVDEEAATITVFAFDEGQRLSEHTAPHEALFHVLDGTARVTVDGEDITVEAGEAVAFPANVPHAVDAETAMTVLLTMVR